MIYLPFLHHLFGTAALSPAQLAVVVPYPFVVWGADEARRWVQRRRVVRSELRNPITSNDRSVETDTPIQALTSPPPASDVRSSSDLGTVADVQWQARGTEIR